MASRQEKYPDTLWFHFYNANPKNKYTDDCVIRAISVGTGKSYSEVLNELVKFQIKTGYTFTDDKCYGKYLESIGWVKHKQLRKGDNTKYTGVDFCGFYTHLNKPDEDCIDNPNANVIAHIGGHHIVAIIPTVMDKFVAYRVIDTWDSTDGCVGVYWTKE